MSKADEFNNGGPGHMVPNPMDPSSSGVHVPMPALPEYVERSMPPPSYEEIMGHQTQTSVNTDSSTDLPPLAYVDIMPRMLEAGNMKVNLAPKFDKFEYVIDAANQWLRSNPGLAVWKCETVERKVETGPTIEMDKMIIHHSTYGFNVFILGVRMWLVKKQSQGPVQQLGLMNVVPEKKIFEYSRVSRHMHYGLHATRTQTYVTYEGLKETIAKFNSKIAANPIPGTILNVEGATVKLFEHFSDDDIDPNLTVYTSEFKFKRKTQILRIFYILGAPSREEICLHEIHPSMTRPPTISTPPQWEHWPGVMGKLGDWLANTRGIRVVNIQAFNARVEKTLDRAKISSDSTDDFEASFLDRQFIRIMRVFYTTGSQIQSPPVSNLSSRLFVPVRTGRRAFESMSETMFRIEAWLRLTGVPIYNVETVHYLLEDLKTFGVELDKCNWIENPRLGNIYVTAIRVYFPCTFMEPDPSRLPPQYYYDPRSGEGSCCSIC